MKSKEFTEAGTEVAYDWQEIQFSNNRKKRYTVFIYPFHNYFMIFSLGIISLFCLLEHCTYALFLCIVITYVQDDDRKRVEKNIIAANSLPCNDRNLYLEKIYKQAVSFITATYYFIAQKLETIHSILFNLSGQYQLIQYHIT